MNAPDVSENESSALTVALYGITVLLSAGLLFIVEPMFANMVLPYLGDTPAVWNTSVVFFQVVLLLGYLYVHVAPRILPRRVQLALHGIVALAPLLLLPFAIRFGTPPTSGATPIIWLLGVLAVGVGAPFFVLSTTGPLSQHWFAGIGHKRSHDPYFLYRASNIGSAIGLLSYPFVIQPLLTLREQARWWAIGYCGFVACIIATAAVTAARGRRAAGEKPRGAAETEEKGEPSPAISTASKLRWILLAAVPSTWMLGLTLYLTTDIAPIPLIWVLPLGLYLISFNVAFGPRKWLSRARTARILPYFVIATVGTLELHASGPLWFIAPLHLVTFFLGALTCHGELAKERPHVRHLTQFYLWVALGGAIGGTLSGIVAPLVFPGFVEYPLAIALGAMLLPTLRAVAKRRYRSDLIYCVFIGGVAVGGLELGSLLHASTLVTRLLAFGPAAFLTFIVALNRIRFGLSLGAMLLASALSIGSPETTLFQARDFFGVSQVAVDSSEHIHILYSGSIIHNEQYDSGKDQDAPLTYYAPSGPAGNVFSAMSGVSRNWNVAVIGLGAGALSCYSTPEQHWTFYEIDPLVVHIATDPEYFTYYQDCLGSRGRIILGDGRISISHARPHSYNLIVVDAFGSDAIPVNLLTQQAMDIYRSKLAPHGIILFNVSNQYIDLTGVIGDLAAREGMVAYQRDDGSLTAEQSADHTFASTWIVVANSETDLKDVPAEAGWEPLRSDGRPVWTDNYSNILQVLRWN